MQKKGSKTAKSLEISRLFAVFPLNLIKARSNNTITITVALFSPEFHPRTASHTKSKSGPKRIRQLNACPKPDLQIGNFGSQPYSSHAFGIRCTAFPAATLAEIPNEITFEQAATLPVAGLSALNARRKGGLLGKRVLITGLTGESDFLLINWSLVQVLTRLGLLAPSQRRSKSELLGQMKP